MDQTSVLSNLDCDKILAEFASLTLHNSTTVEELLQWAEFGAKMANIGIRLSDIRHQLLKTG